MPGPGKGGGRPHPPRIAYWLACVGIGIYLSGTRVFLLASSRVPGVVRALLLIATFQLARLAPALSPYAYVWLLTGWMVMCAALSTRASHGDTQPDLERYLGPSRAAGSPGRPSRSRRDP